MDFYEAKKRIDDIYKTLSQEIDELKMIWQEQLFTWRWWILIILTIIFWAVWIKVRRKESTSRLLYAGLIIALSALILDIIGVFFGLWIYYMMFLLPMPPIVPFNFGILPIIAMLLIQFKPKANPLLKGIIFSSLCSFIGEPFMIWIGIYNPKNWSVFYSFPIYIILFLIAYYAYSRESFHKV